MPRVPARNPRTLATNAELSLALREVERTTDRAARTARDPVSIVRRQVDPLERELVGLLAASLAFGNVRTVLTKIEDALQRLGPSLARIAEDRAAMERALRGWVHRVYRGPDVAALLFGAREVQLDHGSLGARLAADLAREGGLRPALVAFTSAVRARAAFSRESRGGAHILADPSAQSACKRLLLYLRWMVRAEDGTDMGVWSSIVPTSALVIPVDTHIHKLARNLGLTRAKQVTWRTAEEITARLREIDPQDPVRFDFALCHLGMLQRCPSRRDPARCEGCGVMPVCRHWRRPKDLASR